MKAIGDSDGLGLGLGVGAQSAAGLAPAFTSTLGASANAPIWSRDDSNPYTGVGYQVCDHRIPVVKFNRYTGTLYAVINKLTQIEVDTSQYGLYLRRSTDKGATYGAAILIYKVTPASGRISNQIVWADPLNGVVRMLFCKDANGTTIRSDTGMTCTQNSVTVVNASFVTADVGRFVTFTGGANFTTDDFKIISVVNGVSANLDRTPCPNGAGSAGAGDIKARGIIYSSDSLDDGLTWSAPADVTAALLPDALALQIHLGPNKGLEKRIAPNIGRLIGAGYYRRVGHGANPNLFLMYAASTATPASGDWTLGAVPTYVFDGTPGSLILEPAIEELSTGVIYVNGRNHDASAKRIETTSADGGATVATPALMSACPAEIDPCQGSMWKVGNRLCLCFPTTFPSTANVRRIEGQILYSDDNAATWTKRVLHRGAFAYSSGDAVDNNNFVVQAECGYLDPTAGDTAAKSSHHVMQWRGNKNWLAKGVESILLPFNDRSNLEAYVSGAGATFPVNAGIDSLAYGAKYDPVIVGGYPRGLTSTRTTPNLCADFDGGGGYFKLSQSGIPQYYVSATDSFTLEFLIKAATPGAATTQYLFSSAASGARFQMLCTDTLATFLVNDGAAQSVATVAPTGLWNGAWHHAACVLDRGANQIRLYADGTLAATTAFSGGALSSASPAAVVLGALNDATLGFVGQCDGFAFTRAVLAPGSFKLLPTTGDVTGWLKPQRPAQPTIATPGWTAGPMAMATPPVFCLPPPSAKNSFWRDQFCSDPLPQLPVTGHPAGSGLELGATALRMKAALDSNCVFVQNDPQGYVGPMWYHAANIVDPLDTFQYHGWQAIGNSAYSSALFDYINTTGIMSLSFWLNIVSLPSNNSTPSIFFDNFVDNTHPWFRFAIRRSTALGYVNLSIHNESAYNILTANDETWALAVGYTYHVVLTLDGTTGAKKPIWYINLASAASANVTTQATNNPIAGASTGKITEPTAFASTLATHPVTSNLWIGQVAGGGNACNAYMAWPCFFSYVISTADVQTLFADGKNWAARGALAA